MRVNIRRACISDLDKLISLIEAHADFERVSIDTEYLCANLTKAMQGEKPRLYIFLAEANAKLIGYCSITQDFSTWRGRDYIHMDCLYVTASMRGLNIGTLLFRKVEEFAAQQNVNEIEWQTPSWNTNAQYFYESIGATSSLKKRFSYSLNKLASN